MYYVSLDKNSHAFLTQEAATKVKLRQNVGGWVEISIWDIASLWFKNPEMNLGIVIHVNTSTGEEMKIGVKSQPKSVQFTYDLTAMSIIPTLASLGSLPATGHSRVRPEQPKKANPEQGLHRGNRLCRDPLLPLALHRRL